MFCVIGSGGGQCFVVFVFVYLLVEVGCRYFSVVGGFAWSFAGLRDFVVCCSLVDCFLVVNVCF